MKHHVNSQAIKDLVLSEIVNMIANGEYEVTIKKLPKTRTSLQNRALHKYCLLLADALNLAGWSYWATLLRKPLALIAFKRKEIAEVEVRTEYNLGYLEALRDIENSLPRAQVDWTMELVKENFWRPIQVSQISKESTAEAETYEYTIVYENLNRFTGENFGVSLPWPNKENS